jgi:hypothetical protein
MQNKNCSYLFRESLSLGINLVEIKHTYIYIFINNSLIHIRKKFEKFFKFFLFSLRIFDTHSKLEFQCLNTNTHTHKKAIKT